MLRLLSHTATILFVPLLMPLLAVFLAITFDPYLNLFLAPAKAQLTLIVVGLATFVFPLINLFFLKQARIITSYGLMIRRERIAPVVTSLVYFALGYYLLLKGSLPVVLYSMYLGAVISVVLALIITLRWKISMHAIGISGVLGSIYGLFKVHEFVHVPLLVALILATGWVMTARIALQAHTPMQVYAGAALGFVVTWLSVVMGVFV